MKTMISGLVGLSLLAVFAGPAAAETLAKKKQRYHAAQGGGHHNGTRAPPESDYYEHIADKLPIGSTIWWEQMNRERRGGRAG